MFDQVRHFASVEAINWNFFLCVQHQQLVHAWQIVQTRCVLCLKYLKTYIYHTNGRQWPFRVRRKAWPQRHVLAPRSTHRDMDRIEQFDAW